MDRSKKVAVENIVIQALLPVFLWLVLLWIAVFSMIRTFLKINETAGYLQYHIFYGLHLQVI